MVNVIIEYVMFIPLMIVVIIIFSTVATTMVSTYVDQQRLVIAQGVVNKLANTIHQLSYSLNQDESGACTVTKTTPLQATIDSYPYRVTGHLNNLKDKLRLILAIQGLQITVNKTITLGPNTLWQDSELSSLSPEAAIEVIKFTNKTLLFSFR